MREQSITCPLTYIGVIEISGPDAGEFLQGQVSCDVTKASHDTSLLGAYCNIKGRVISIFRLYLIGDNYYLTMPTDIIESTLMTFNKYAVFSKVTLRDCSEEFVIVNEDAKQALFTRDQMKHELKGNEISACNAEYKRQNILSGIPTVYSSSQDKFLPHYLNLHELGALDFDKGCYLGQEIIARMHYRGSLKYKMQHVVIETNQDIFPGDKYQLNGEDVDIVDLVKNPEKGFDALVVAKIS